MDGGRVIGATVGADVTMVGADVTTSTVGDAVVTVPIDGAGVSGEGSDMEICDVDKEDKKSDPQSPKRMFKLCSQMVVQSHG